MPIEPFLGTFDRNLPKRIQRRHADIINISRAVAKCRNVPKEGLHRVLLIDIIETSFRYSEKTIFEHYIRAYRREKRRWIENETFMAINKAKTMAIFFIAETRINDSIVLDTRKWRIQGKERWSLDNITYYAEQCGLELMIPGESTILEITKAA